jgi:hypothetical protein
MAAIVRGIKSQSIRQSEENGSIDRYGVDMLTLVEEISADAFPRLVRAKNSVHPRFTSMAVSKISWSRGPHGKFYRVTYTYEGFLGRLPEPTYVLSSSLSEEPIELHPDFAEFAGTPSSPNNGAVFIDPETGKKTTDDNKGVFREFAFSGGDGFAGIESFLSPGATWQEISFSTNRPSDLGRLGQIDNPSGSNPSFGSGRNWIYSAADYTRRGGIYEIRKTWLLSGRNGWKSELY